MLCEQYFAQSTVYPFEIRIDVQQLAKNLFSLRQASTGIESIVEPDGTQRVKRILFDSALIKLDGFFGLIFSQPAGCGVG